MPAASQGRNSNITWTVAILLMAACAAATLWFPVFSINALPSNSYNEGWNAYRQWMTVQGRPLYGSPPGWWTTNYPFLSFHLIGLLGGTKANMVLAGRIVCLFCLIVTAAVNGIIVWTVTGSRRGALYAGLCLLAWFASFYSDARASDDPEMLGLAFTSLGLLAYVYSLKARDSWFSLSCSSILFTAALFTKDDTIAFPLAVATHLACRRDWRALAVFGGTGIAASVLLLILTFHFDGPYFFTALLQGRAYSLQNLGYETGHYLLHFLILLVLGIVLLLRAGGNRCRFLLFLLLGFTHVIAVYFSGGDGVAANIFFPPIIADLLACVTGLCWLEQKAMNGLASRRGFRIALLLCTVAGIYTVPLRVRYDLAAARHLPAATQAARQAIADLESTRGPVICEDILLCYEAGKPLGYDPYYVEDQILRGRLREAPILALLDSHHFAMIQVDGLLDRAALAHRNDRRFSIPFLRALLAHYKLVLANQDDSIFVPR